MFNNRKYNFDTVFNKRLYLSMPCNFNDPFDSFIGMKKKEFVNAYLKKYHRGFINEMSKEELSKTLDYFENVVKCKKKEEKNLARVKNKKLNNDINKLYKKYFNKLNEIINRNYIACFTTNNPVTNMPMWSFYSNNYKGFCAEYTFETLQDDVYLKNIDKYQKYIYNRIYKVKYISKNIYIDCEKLLEIDLDDLDRNQYIKKTIHNALIQKNKNWNFENEYRLILNDKDIRSIKKIKNNSVQSAEAGHLIIMAPQLESIYIYDKKISRDMKKKVNNIARANNIFKNHLSNSSENKNMIINENFIDKNNIDLKVKKLPF